MGKSTLHLYIDDDLKKLAKDSDQIKSISAEFETWLRIRLLQTPEDYPIDLDLDKEIAIQKAKLLDLERKSKSKQLIDQAKVDRNDLIKRFVERTLREKQNPLDQARSLQFIFKGKRKEIITLDEARELIQKELDDKDG